MFCVLTLTSKIVQVTEMGRLSAYAKNQILKLRFQKHNKITQIVKILTKEDIKISRQSVSTFLKKYLETDSILDKPRSGRKKKLTNDEIEQIGELTRNDPNITARAIKDKLGLTVSTYTILRASKLFEWNKLNPNSNEAKKAAALERELRGERRRKAYPKKAKKHQQHADSSSETINYLNQSTSSVELAPPTALQIISLNQQDNEDSSIAANELLALHNENLDDMYDLKMINEREIISLKNTACSPMSFATKVLFRVFSLHELHGHNVSGKTFHKHISHKEPLEEKRLMYIKWLVEKYFYYPFLTSISNHQASSTANSNFLSDSNVYYYKNKDILWKACCNAINKMIRRSEVSHLKSLEKGDNPQMSLQTAYNSNDNQENSQQQQQQQQHIVQLSVSGVHASGSSGNTNLNKFNQLTQYLINEERERMSGIDAASFVDEIELISNKRQLFQAKLEIEDDDSGSEIELLNENKLMMNITNQKNLNKNTEDVSMVTDDQQQQQQQEKNENLINKNKQVRSTAQSTPVVVEQESIPVAKRSARIANKKTIEIVSKKTSGRSFQIGKQVSNKQQQSKKGELDNKVKKPRSNYYYESDDDNESDDGEDDDDDESDVSDDEDDDMEDEDEDESDEEELVKIPNRRK